MTYENRYLLLVNFRKKHPLRAEKYGENHHVMMRSLYPNLKDTKDNIVRLSAAEHFKAHYYLWRTYKDELKDKVAAKKAWYALKMMMAKTVKHIDSEEQLAECAMVFAEHREFTPCGEEHSRWGCHLTEETKTRISKARTGKHYGYKPMLGKKHSKDAIEKMRLAHKGHRFSESHRRNLAEANRRRAIREKELGIKRSAWNKGMKGGKLCST